MPKVHNRRGVIPEGTVYVGRPSPWGNPFIIGRDGDRLQVIEKYEIWLTEQLKDPTLRRQLREELGGKDLACWCAPLPCHAEILLDWANCIDCDGLCTGLCVA